MNYKIIPNPNPNPNTNTSVNTIPTILYL